MDKQYFSSTQTSDNEQWKTFYHHAVSRQVKSLITFIRDGKRKPDTLIRHFDSIVVVIEEAAKHPEIETRANLLNLFESLHPLPLWWGKWTEWMRVTEKVIHIAKETNDVQRQFWLYLIQSEMLITGGNEKKALILAEKALALAKTYNDPEMIFKAEMTVFEAKKDLGYIGDRTEAIAMLEKALDAKKERIPEKNAKLLEVAFLLKKTDVLRRLGERRDALYTIQRAHTLANDCIAEDDLLRAQIYNRRGAAFWTDEQPRKAIEDFEKATEIFEKWGDQASKIYSIGYTGLVWWSVGEYPKAQKILQSSISMAEKIKALQWQAIQIGNLALVHLMQGNLPDALALAKQHYALSVLINNRAEIERANVNIGYTQVFRGNFQEARERFTRYLEFTEEMQFVIGSGVASANMAWVMDALGFPDDALSYAEKAFCFAEKADAPLLKIVALRSLSEAQKDPTARAAYAEEARALAKKRSRRFNEAGALLTLADCHQDESIYKEAIQLLEELGATNWLSVPLVFKSLRLPVLYWG